MSASLVGSDAEMLDAIETLRAFVIRTGCSIEGDALRLVESMVLSEMGKYCPLCEAQPGDNDFCVVAGDVHAWARGLTRSG